MFNYPLNDVQLFTATQRYKWVTTAFSYLLKKGFEKKTIQGEASKRMGNAPEEKPKSL